MDDLSEHAEHLKQGKVAEWNDWWTRQANARSEIGKFHTGLVGIDLSGVDLTGIDLRRWNLRGAKFLKRFDKETQLAHARLSHCVLLGAKFDGADLHGASLRKSNLTDATFERCNLRHANLTGATVKNANFINCSAYGAGLWATKGKPDRVTLYLSAKKLNMRADRTGAEQDFVAHDLDSAAFLYLLADNPRISAAFDELNRCVVLILGRFAKGGLDRLRAMKHRLRGDYAPIVFDFLAPERRSLTETVNALAHMSNFVIADLTDASSVPQELSGIVPFLPSVPVVPVLREGEPYAMFEHWLRYPWVLDPVRYGVNFEEFLENRFRSEVVDRAAGLRHRLRDRIVRG